MKAFLLVNLILFSNRALFAQQGSFIVEFGEIPARVLPTSYRYLNSEFREGFLSLPMGRTLKFPMLNYDLYYQHLTFINEKKDTLVIKADLAVKYAHIGNEQFYHDVEKGYLKILVTDSLHSLTSHVQLEEGKLPVRPKDEGYGGTTNGTSATETSSRNQDTSFKRTTSYFLLDQQGAITKCNKSGFFKMFPNKDNLVKTYIKKENIDFGEEKDNIRLFTYCLSLPPEK